MYLRGNLIDNDDDDGRQTTTTETADGTTFKKNESQRGQSGERSLTKTKIELQYIIRHDLGSERGVSEQYVRMIPT